MGGLGSERNHFGASSPRVRRGRVRCCGIDDCHYPDQGTGAPCLGSRSGLSRSRHPGGSQDLAMESDLDFREMVELLVQAEEAGDWKVVRLIRAELEALA